MLAGLLRCRQGFSYEMYSLEILLWPQKHFILFSEEKHHRALLYPFYRDSFPRSNCNLRALQQYLVELDLPVYVIHIQRRESGMIKTDKRDALGLANQLSNQLELDVQVTDKLQVVFFLLFLYLQKKTAVSRK